MQSESFFIAGTMQGSRKGSAQVDQAYRQRISETITKVFPGAVINCPAAVMERKLRSREPELRQAHQRLTQQSSVNTSEFDPSLKMLTGVFHELVDLAADSDVCIAYLPDHEASMGTAVEMFAANRNDKTVIAITGMVQNLAVMSCASIIIPSIDDLERTLTTLVPRLTHPSCTPL